MRLGKWEGRIWGVHAFKEFLNRINIIRFVSLFRAGGALHQLGWLRVDVRRLKYSGKRSLPWFTYGAIDFIDCQIPPKVRVLELGGGGSTLFWLDKGASVVTIETDSTWHTTLEQVVGPRAKWTLINMEKIDTVSLNSAPLGMFDVIVNDHAGGNRAEVATWLLEHLNKDGYIIWDNSDRREYLEGLLQIRGAGLGSVAFFGLGPINSYAWETTIFSSRLTSPDWHLPAREYIDY